MTAQQVGLNRGTGRFYKTSARKQAESLFLWELKKAVPEKPLQEPIALEIVWMFESKNKRNHGNHKTTRPDLDNHQKIIQDCMTKLNFWEDDSRVSFIVSRKIWTEEEGISIRAKTIGQTWDNIFVLETLV